MVICAEETIEGHLQRKRMRVSLLKHVVNILLMAKFDKIIVSNFYPGLFGAIMILNVFVWSTKSIKLAFFKL